MFWNGIKSHGLRIQSQGTANPLLPQGYEEEDKIEKHKVHKV